MFINPTESTTKKSLPKTTQLKPKEEEKKNIYIVDTECSICMDENSDQVFIPCGHVCVCKNCVAESKLKECPICRADIKKVLPLSKF